MQSPIAMSVDDRDTPPVVRNVRAAKQPDGWYEFLPGQEARCPGTRKLSPRAIREGGRDALCCEFLMEVGPGTMVRVRVDEREGERGRQRESGGHRTCTKCGGHLVIDMPKLQGSAA